MIGFCGDDSFVIVTVALGYQELAIVLIIVAVMNKSKVLRLEVSAFLCPRATYDR